MKNEKQKDLNIFMKSIKKYMSDTNHPYYNDHIRKCKDIFINFNKTTDKAGGGIDVNYLIRMEVPELLYIMAMNGIQFSNKDLNSTLKTIKYHIKDLLREHKKADNDNLISITAIEIYESLLKMIGEE